MAVDSKLDIPLRREFKYLVPRSDVPALRASLQGLCRLDPHAGPNNSYRLRSLYLDAPDLRLFHANEREAVSRFKARIRTYPDDPEAPVIAEIKDRNGDIIRKIRASLPEEDWTQALKPGGCGAEAPAALHAFTSRVLRHDLRPVCLVQYAREAWVSEWDEYARVSIDSRIECQASHEWTLEDQGSWRPIDHALLSWTQGSVCVVELKWAEVAPLWMMRLVQELDLLRHSFSKYCYSMTSLSEDHYRDYRRASSTWA